MFALKNNRTRTINFGISSKPKLKLFLRITVEIDQKWFFLAVIGTFKKLSRFLRIQNFEIKLKDEFSNFSYSEILTDFQPLP